MEHLNLEALARLVDDAPDAAERRHLSECQRCRTELELLQGQTDALGQLPDMRPPRGDWVMLEARLMSEGLLRHQRSPLASTPGWMKVAAAVLLFVGGTGLGFVLDGAAAPGPTTAAVSDGSPYTLTSTTAGSVEEAEEVVRLAERQYMDALVQYRQLVDAREDDASASERTESRLAALELLVAAGKAAVQQAPTDPFLNGFLASTMAERQATYQAALTSSGSGNDWY